MEQPSAWHRTRTNKNLESLWGSVFFAEGKAKVNMFMEQIKTLEYLVEEVE